MPAHSDPEPIVNGTNLKPWIVRCRRGYDPDAWKSLRSFIDTNLEPVCAQLNTRWLVSIADTYSDYGNDAQRASGTLIATVANMEKLAITARRNGGDIAEAWDGMTTWGGGDMLENLGRRWKKVLERTGIVDRLFWEVVRRMSESDSTTLGMLAKRWPRLHHRMSTTMADPQRTAIEVGSAPCVVGPYKSRDEWLASLPKGMVFAEVGVANGSFSRTILRIAQPSKIYLIDSWDAKRNASGAGNDVPWWTPKHTSLSQYKSVVEHLRHPEVTILRLTSSEARTVFADDSLDGIYIDAAHDEESVWDDMGWYSKVKPGGVFSGHDYCLHTFHQNGVFRSVNRFANQHDLRFEVTDEKIGTWYLAKPPA